MSNPFERETLVILLLVQLAMIVAIGQVVRLKQPRRVRVLLREDGSLIELEAANPDDFKVVMQLVNEGEK